MKKIIAIVSAIVLISAMFVVFYPIETRHGAHTVDMIAKVDVRNQLPVQSGLTQATLVSADAVTNAWDKDVSYTLYDEWFGHPKSGSILLSDNYKVTFSLNIGDHPLYQDVEYFSAMGEQDQEHLVGSMGASYSVVPGTYNIVVTLTQKGLDGVWYQSPGGTPSMVVTFTVNSDWTTSGNIV